MVRSTSQAGDGDGEKPSNLFKEINDLGKSNYLKDELKKQDTLAKFSETTVCGKIARSRHFEYFTLAVIILNALYLGYDADYSARWGKPDELYSDEMPIGFIVLENVFCVLFTLELLIRFLGYVYKLMFIRDLAFLFDLALVVLMLAETYPLAIMGSGGGLSQLSILRLLRLARILRMGKVLRFFPELALIVKGMAAAVRAVGSVGILMLLVVYVFAIIFTAEYHQGWRADEDIGDDDIAFYFGSLGKSFRHLFIMATILDDITACLNVIRSTNNMIMVGVFLVLVGISAFMLFNMLVGILCEVVDQTSHGEKTKMRDKEMKQTCGLFFESMDINRDAQISRQEFELMKTHPVIMKSLKRLDIGPDDLCKYADLFFGKEAENSGNEVEKTMHGDECVAMLMQLRPGRDINLCDFKMFRKNVLARNVRIGKYLDVLEWFVEELGGFDDSDGETRAKFQAKESGSRANQKRGSRKSLGNRRSSLRSNQLASGPSRRRKARRSPSTLVRSPAMVASLAPSTVSVWHHPKSARESGSAATATQPLETGTTILDSKIQELMDKRRLKYLQIQEELEMQQVMVSGVSDNEITYDADDYIWPVMTDPVDSNDEAVTPSSSDSGGAAPDSAFPQIHRAWL